MIQKKRSFILAAKVLGVLLFCSVFAYNIGIRINSQNGKLSLSTLKAYAFTGDSNAEEEVASACPACIFVKDTQLSQAMYVTSVTGSAATEAGIQIGTKFSAEWSAKIKAQVTAALKDVYKITCTTGGKAACTATEGGFILCATSGCPTAGTVGDK
ncbi:hypothetical protein GCM10023149_43520 [Mucilaginibacter gynuensis]|uniref:Uncharacterized protein n=1 Tax=Mucilaginibacter gynuensis TaxID=1302236 RepID=A0ABP8H7W3_9SPHI